MQFKLRRRSSESVFSNSSSVCSYSYSPDIKDATTEEEDQLYRRRLGSQSPSNERRRRSDSYGRGNITIGTSGQDSDNERAGYSSEYSGGSRRHLSIDKRRYIGGKTTKEEILHEKNLIAVVEEKEDCRRNYDRTTDSRQRRINESFWNSAGNLDRRSSTSNSSSSEEYATYSVEGTEIRVEEAFIFDAARDYVYYEKAETGEDRIRQLFAESFRRTPVRKRILHDVYEALPGSGASRLDTAEIHRRYPLPFQLPFITW